MDRTGAKKSDAFLMAHRAKARSLVGLFIKDEVVELLSFKGRIQGAGLAAGLYFRTETGGLILLGKSTAEYPVDIDSTWDKNGFIDRLRPELAQFVPSFDILFGPERILENRPLSESGLV